MIWHKITGYLAHRGSGRRDQITIYYCGRDALEAMDYYSSMPGVKRNSIPDVIPLSEEQSNNLEKKLREKGISIKKVPGQTYIE